MKAMRRGYCVSFGVESAPSQERFSGRHFRLDHACLSRFFAKAPAPLFDDFLRVAMSIYVIDRQLKRRGQRSDRWARRIRASFEVGEPSFWSDGLVHGLLTRSLEFISGDCWQIQFEKATERIVPEPSNLYHDPLGGADAIVCLYSGGLDSAAGLVHRILECPKRPVIPVTVWHQPRQRVLISQQFQILKTRFGAQLSEDHVLIKAAMMWPSQFKYEERSQRCRSFLFAAIGGIVAAMQGSSTVEVFESGVGAINLPAMAGMAGSKATRSCHPEFLRQMSELVTLIAGREIVYRLPFFGVTKGEMVKVLAQQNLDDLARSTASCVHYPLRERPHKQCGFCPACIFRRQAMFVAGIEELNGTYKYDLFGPSQAANGIPHRCLKYANAFLMQIMHLSDLQTHGELPGRVRRHLLGSGILCHDESPAPIVELLLRYRQEWLNIVAEGIKRGWNWVRLLIPTNSAKQEGLCHASA